VYRQSQFSRLEQRFERPNTRDIDILGILRTWLGTSLDANRLIIAAMLMALAGTPRDLAWWRSVEPNDEMSHRVWANTYYILQRRRWQPANTQDV
jgi:hypothetical protein